MEIDDIPFLRAAIKSSLENSEQLHRDAEVLCATKSYCHAYALALMSEEEFGRAVIYHLISENLFVGEFLPKKLKSYLIDGQYEELAKQASTMGLVIVTNIEEMIAHMMKVSYNHSQSRLKNNSKMSENNNDQNLRDTEFNFINKIRIEYAKFNTLHCAKERNFYVTFDFKNRKISTPDSVGKKEIEKYLVETKNRFESYKPFFSIKLTTSVEKRVKNQICRLMKVGHY